MYKKLLSLKITEGYREVFGQLLKSQGVDIEKSNYIIEELNQKVDKFFLEDDKLTEEQAKNYLEVNDIIEKGVEDIVEELSIK